MIRKLLIPKKLVIYSILIFPLYITDNLGIASSVDHDCEHPNDESNCETSFPIPIMTIDDVIKFLRVLVHNKSTACIGVGAFRGTFGYGKGALKYYMDTI